MIDIIGFSGRAGAGKTTAAKHLIDKHAFWKVSFAAPLKSMALALGLTEAQVYGDEKEAPLSMLGGHTPRWVMQSLGTEWGRTCMGPDFWVDLAVDKVHTYRKLGYRVVFDDVRFPNEVKAIREMGGLVIHITGGKSDPNPGTHESETQELGRDWLIRNDLARPKLMPDLIDAIIWNEGHTDEQRAWSDLQRDAC